MRIAAGIITYNPNICDIQTCLTALLGQVEVVLIVDNASSNIDELRDAVAHNPQVTLIANDENRGFAAGLTQMFGWARSHGFDWVLTLNDDSIVPSHMVDTYRKVLERADGNRIGIVCCLLKNRLDGTLLHSKCSDDECITSGSLTRVKAWESIGGFDEWLVIDGVDFDFSRRMVRAGWQIVECQNVVMKHQIGQARSVNLLVKHPIVWNHNAQRKYYIARNMQYIDYKLDTYSYGKSLKKLCWDMLCVILWEKDKWHKMQAMLHGWRDGKQKIREMRVDKAKELNDER